MGENRPPRVLIFLALLSACAPNNEIVTVAITEKSEDIRLLSTICTANYNDSNPRASEAFKLLALRLIGEPVDVADFDQGISMLINEGVPDATSECLRIAPEYPETKHLKL